MAIALFDFMDALFDKGKYKTLSDTDKRSNFFMAQRFMSIVDPVHANFFNKVGINQVVVMDYWNRLMNIKYPTKPRWTFTKKEEAGKQFEDDKFAKKFAKIENTTILEYLRRNKLSRKDYDFHLEINPEHVYEKLLSLQEYLNEQ